MYLFNIIRLSESVCCCKSKTVDPRTSGTWITIMTGPGTYLSTTAFFHMGRSNDKQRDYLKHCGLQNWKKNPKVVWMRAGSKGRNLCYCRCRLERSLLTITSEILCLDNPSVEWFLGVTRTFHPMSSECRVHLSFDVESDCTMGIMGNTFIRLAAHYTPYRAVFFLLFRKLLEWPAGRGRPKPDCFWVAVSDLAPLAVS